MVATYKIWVKTGLKKVDSFSGENLRSSYENQSNFRHVVFMVIAMIAFAIEDAIIKQLAFKLPISQVLISVGLSGLSVLYALVF